MPDFLGPCTSLAWSDRFNQHLIACSVSSVCSQSELIFLYSIMLWLCGWLFCVWSVLFGKATEWRLMILWNFSCCCGNESIYVEKDQPSLLSERFSETFHPTTHTQKREHKKTSSLASPTSTQLQHKHILQSRAESPPFLMLRWSHPQGSNSSH